MIEKLKNLKSALGYMIQQHSIKRKSFGYIAKSAYINTPTQILNHQNIYLYDHVHLMDGARLLITKGKFIMKHHSCAAQGLVVLTGNHISKPGTWFLTMENRADDYEKDVIVEEDVWIGINVILLTGVTIGRGAIIGAGSVVRSSIPPYAIVTGNPAKVVGFKFNPLEIIEHEKKLYPENERLTLDTLMENYQIYYYNKIEEITKYLKL